MKKNTNLPAGLYENLLIGAFVGLVACIILMFFAALVLTLRDFSPAAATPISTVIWGIGALVGGYFAAYRHRQKGLLVGLGVGCILFVVYVLVSLLLGGSFSFTVWVRLVVIALASALGGIFGVNMQNRQKKV